MLLTSLPVMTWPWGVAMGCCNGALPWGVAMGRCHCTHTHMVKTIPRKKSSKQRNDAMKKKYIYFFNGGNVAKHWNVAGRGIWHLWLPCWLSYGVHKLFHHISTKWSPAAILFFFRWSPKSIGFFHSRSSMAVSNMNLIRALVSQLRDAACGGCGGDGLRTKTIISSEYLHQGKQSFHIMYCMPVYCTLVYCMIADRVTALQLQNHYASMQMTAMPI